MFLHGNWIHALVSIVYQLSSWRHLTIWSLVFQDSFSDPWVPHCRHVVSISISPFMLYICPTPLEHLCPCNFISHACHSSNLDVLSLVLHDHPKKIYLPFQFVLTYLYHFVVFTSEGPFLSHLEYGWEHTASWYLLLVAIVWYLSDKIYLGSSIFYASLICLVISIPGVLLNDMACPRYTYSGTQSNVFPSATIGTAFLLRIVMTIVFLAFVLIPSALLTLQPSQHFFQFHSQLREEDITFNQFDDPMPFIF